MRGADEIAAAVFAGVEQLCFSDADGVRYTFALQPDLFAAPIAHRGSQFVMRRTDGCEMKGTWGRTVASRKHEIYSVESMTEMIRSTMEAGCGVTSGPAYGPHQPTSADTCWAWDIHTNAFRTAYKTAWETRNWVAVRNAAAAFRRDFPRWAVSASDVEAALHDSASTIARNMRGEVHPFRWKARSRYHQGRARKGFAAHVARETEMRAAWAAVAALPGYADDDSRDVVPIIVRWTCAIRHVQRAELMSPARFLHPVKPDGSAMPRAASIERSQVEAIKPTRRGRAAA